MRVISKAVLLLLIPAVIIAAHSLAPGRQADNKLRDSRFIAEGARLFARSCGNAYCHGSAGAGGGAPRLRDNGLEAAYVFKAISNGIPGTSMPSFKSELSEEQVWKLVAFIISDTESNPSPAPSTLSQPAPSIKTPRAVAPDATAGNVEAGKALFFGSGRPSCHFCHAFRGEGTPIGPDLSKIGSRSPRDLFSSVILSREIRDPRYATVTLILRSGEKIVGVKKEEDAESIRIYDTTELPAVLRTVQKSEVARVETGKDSVMPKDYASRYTVKQLLDLIAFLKGSESSSPVTLKDLF